MGKSIKCLVVGNDTIGKSSFIVTYCCKCFPNEIIPFTVNNFSTKQKIGEKIITINAIDTDSDPAYDEIRSLMYREADIIIICFSLVDSSSFKNGSTKWYKEIEMYNDDVPFILVGLKKDLRENFIKRNLSHKVVKESEGERLKKEISALDYIECSSKYGLNVEEVFHKAAKIVLGEDDDSSFSSNIKCILI